MNKKSFTLIELLVVIAIIGILSSLVIARFSDWGDNARIASTLQWSAGVHRTLGANLVGHWPLNDSTTCSGSANGDTIKDISGYNNNGTVTVANWSDESPNDDNCSLSFYDISSNASAIVSSGDINQMTSDFTVSAWVKFDTTVLAGSDTCILCRWNSAVDGQFLFGYREASGAKGISLYVLKDDVRIDSYRTNWDPLVNTWYHVVGVYKPSTYVRIYVNSSLDFQRTYGVYDFLSDKPLVDLIIGKIGSNPWPGNISDVRLYNTSLTAEEVGRIYAETKNKYLAYE